ncbi:hypothetical protein RM697_10960 [Ichthyenterobacterium sp. W332]|uniref:Lipoprotein n=1 Tax=Microcosmobacter mediterraneus TaxID=3075607 RepID=A0ABU2YLZ4_9FLAO|nr:hypothetical protein [Ichthyenterobacterium sp. W332]MDT0559173.1 hypothetical protein [Ichthyenterobacterium sp. W332]
MTRSLILILTILTVLSCGNESDKMIYKTQGGEFASKPGNFIANFPTKPNHSAIDNQIGLDKFKIHVFRSTLGPNKIFSIEYLDYPEHMIKSMTNEQIYAQGVTNFSNKMAETFQLEFQEPIKQHGMNGHYFLLELKQNQIDQGIKGHIQGKLFRNGNRVYTITFMGQDDKNIDIFMKSFRLIDHSI